MAKLPICVFTEADDNKEGLFGYVFQHVFLILPHLLKQGIFPAWEIRAMHYGTAPDFITIPGALDLAYTPPPPPYRYVSLNEFRRRHAYDLGSDFHDLSRIWHRYFKIPPRVQQQADRLMPKGRVLGLHYRGTDKLTNKVDSNPISHEQFLIMVREFLDTQPPFDAIFAATDEIAFVDKLTAAVNLPVVNLGEVEFHLALDKKIPAGEKTDRAMLDCVLLSQCACVIETSSALPSFAAIFNPHLEIYRTAASKRFAHMPYFPVAFVPVLPVTSAASKAILAETMVDDWTFDPTMAEVKKGFSHRIRRPLHHTLFTLAEKLGADDIISAHRHPPSR